MPTDMRPAARRVMAARRILILGSSGAGKSRFAKRLCSLLGTEPLHLDALFWRPGGRPSPQSEWRLRLADLVQRDAWVMDGTYESTLDLRLPRAQAILYLEESRVTCLWRVLCRTARPSESHGQRVDLGLARYIWRFAAVTRCQVLALIRENHRDEALLMLRGSKRIGAFLCALESESERAQPAL